jgi:preprotein translocase subunit SecD
MQNHYPLWKNLLLVGILLIGLIYAAPNLFGEDPSIQISAKGTQGISTQVQQNIHATLEAKQLKYLSITPNKEGLLVRFPSTDTQLLAKDEVQNVVGEDYIVALNLTPRTPKWLQALGAHPMKLGLDLRGGVHFLLQVDVNALLTSREQGDMRSISDALRDANIRYTGISQTATNGIALSFNDAGQVQQALSELKDKFPDYQYSQSGAGEQFIINAKMTEAAYTKVANYAVDQAMNILRNRVNALGVSEALVQRQGRDQINVEMPGIQDTARAKSIIGKAATLKFELVDVEHDAQSAAAGDVPIGSKVYMYENRPILIKDRIILHGDSITYATASFDQSGRPAVNVRLGGGTGDSVSMFNRVTGDNVGKPMAVIYVETQMVPQNVDGKITMVSKEAEQIISVATIQSALGNSFEISGLESTTYAQNLALLLRSGALFAPMSFMEENTIGPSMGEANIHMGLMSVIIGFLAVVVFMVLYYRLFGLIADVALLLNLVFIVAIFSILGVTMTLPGIAAMVLTVGLAVDANVLIYERIREELRNGISPQAAIHIGYERAFVTIVDSNITTLIIALVLFALGSGIVKGFAVTLIVGILTSMTTAIVFTRALVNWSYGGKTVKQLSIGIKVK